ncbi:hypothetical protein DEIPH_ctg052orf0011 [Deinococcus phoenicis]|uniref:Uncharacterized protein n=1 Tax=Deinococcus phoenicis TaxID=1476583 RepID=A0A016QMC0_9DEIO|nr:hypothetical protein [Deinococcus phoenicis]EYB67017.1 hypothetical protein DEIPH_ctg052orf0011 [Deinococcus phoenicis]
MTGPSLPAVKGDAVLNNAAFRKGVQEILSDLRAIQELSKKVGTLKITADLSAGKDVQKAVRAIRDAVEEAVPSSMQRRISDMFGGFQLGANAAQQSASAFEAQGAALRARLNEVGNAIRLTRAEFQAGIGEATPEEVSQLTTNMRRLKGEMEALGAEAKQTFGEWSNEALKAAMATRTAEQTAAAANGQFSRLGLASQVKLGAGEALRQFGPQAGATANSFIGLARGFDQARVSSKLFETQLKNNNVALDAGQKAAHEVADTLKLTSAESEGFVGRLARQGMTADQAAASLVRAGASAKLAGRSTAEGAENFVSAVEAGDSAMLASIGISENLSTYYDKLAKSLGKKSDDLTKAEKAQAAYNLVLAAASDELDLYKQGQDGLTGSSADMELSIKQAQLALGEAFLPAVNLGTRLLVGFADAFNALPDPIQGVTGLLLASGVAVGILYAPVSALIGGVKTLTTARAAATVAETAGVAVEGAMTASTIRLNVVTALKRVLLMDVGALYAKANTQAMLYQGSLASGAVVTNVFAGATMRAGTALKTFVGAISIYTVAATAALALGLYWADSVKKTTAIYEEADEASQKSFEKTMQRVQALVKEGSELSRAKAKVLLLQQQLSDAQQGELKGVNIFGERIYGKPDEARIKKLQADLVAARQNMTVLYTEAEKRGRTNVILTEDQTKAVKALREELEGRSFDLKLSGMTDLQADLARLGKDFDKLRQEFKKPFVVNGKLMDPAQTPALREGLAGLDAQRLAEEASLRKKYADEAVKTTRDAALAAQRAELEAMQEGAAKRRAQRQAEIDDINRETAEKVEALADFPARQKEVEAAARREIAAKRKGWVREDQQLARESARRVAEAEKSARDAVIGAMRGGYAKEEAVRHAALEDLKTDIAERVRALEGDPTAQAGVRDAGARQLAALQQQQDREREKSAEDAAKRILDAERSTRDARIAAMEDGYAKEEATRRAALDDLRQSLRDQVKELEGYPDQQARIIQEGNRQILALEQQQARERRKAREDVLKSVLDAEKAARDATIAAIKDEEARKRAERNAELVDLQQQTRERLKTLKDFPAEQARVQQAAREQQRAKQQQWANEDEQDAKERAQRIAKAWQDAQSAQFAAQQAARDQQAAQYELSVSRQLAQAQDRVRAGVAGATVEAARIEAEAAQHRYQLAKVAADKQYTEDRKRLADARDLALDNDKLSATERQAIWTQFYADLSGLDSKHQADATQRLQQREEQERAAAEAIRQARIQEANRPVEQSQNRQQQLEWSRDLSRSDVEILGINQQISAERAGQIAALQGQLDGLNGVRLTAEERLRVEQQLAGLQHDQAAALREQVDLAREVRQSALDRLDAEAQLAERLARTEADRVRAQRQQLATAQLRVRDLDDQIAGEGREKERNALISQRYGLLGQIADLQDKINSAPLDAEQRRLDLYRAQAQAELALRGLGENRVATANLTAEIAARELLLANQRVAAARTELELQAALVGQAQARGTFAQALTAQMQAGRERARQAEDLDTARSGSAREAARAAEDFVLAQRQAAREATKRQLELENGLLDAAEARAKALLQIRGLAEDAVLSAQQELQTAREKLALSEQQLVFVEGPEERAGILRERIQLLAQVAEQERKVAEVRAAEEEVTRQLGSAEARLMAEVQGGVPGLEQLEEVTRRVGAARARLAQAEGAYAAAREMWAKAPTTQNSEALDAAANRLTAAIREQRKELRALAGEYRTTISQMDGVREANERLQQVVYSEGGRTFDSRRERERLEAIAARRDAAIRRLQATIDSGDRAAIQQATQDLAAQEERYRKQADLLEKNGVKFSRTGQQEVKALTDKLDDLGVGYDREAALLEGRAQAVDKEAQAAITFSDGVDRFAENTAQLVGALERAYGDLQTALRGVKAERDTEAARQDRRRAEDYATSAQDRARQNLRREEDASDTARGTGSVAGNMQDLDRIAGKLVQGTQPLPQALSAFADAQVASRAIVAGTERLERLLQGAKIPTATATPIATTQPAPQSVTYNFEATINAPSDKAPDMERAARRVFGELIHDAKLHKTWGVKKC